MESLNQQIKQYKLQLNKGYLQKAYKGIMTFMFDLMKYLEKKYPQNTISALYFGYMDMTYFAFTPPTLKNKKLKIAIVYLHEKGRFEVWLAGINKDIQEAYINQLSHMNITKYSLSKKLPGVDSIIEYMIVENPDFDYLDQLKNEIEGKTIDFINDITSILDNE